MPPMHRRLFFLFVITLLFSHCSSSIKPGHQHIIGLQPIGHYAPEQLQFIQKELHAFFKVPVVILEERAMPASFINLSKGERYSADSIIRWLRYTAPGLNNKSGRPYA